MSVFVQQFGNLVQFTKDSWAILSPIEQSIKNKIESYGVPLKDWNISINYGIKTGCNDAFIIDGAKRAELIAADPKSDEIIRPILRGRDIKRYGYDFADLWVIALLPSRNYDIEDYPAIRDWLKSFGKKLEQTGETYIDDQGIEQKCRKKTKHKWFETQDSIAYWNDFSKQKIVYGQFRRGAFALDTQGCFLSSNEYFIWTDQLDLKYLLGLLNSRVCYYYGCVSMNSLGGATTIAQKDIFIKFPIMEPDETTKQKIIELVDKILDRKSNGLDPRDLEEEINNTLYDMYGFSDEEREAIVEITSQQD